MNTTYHPDPDGVCRTCGRPAAFSSNPGGYGALCPAHFQAWFRQREPLMDAATQATYRQWWAAVSAAPLSGPPPAPVDEHIIVSLADLLGPQQLRLW